MKVALVDFPACRITNEPSLKEVMGNFGVIPSISLLYVAAILEKLGIELLYLDLMAMRLNKDEALARLRHFQPDLIGFTIYTSHFHHAMEWVRYFKEHTGADIMVGGVHTQIYPIETLKYIPQIDYVLVGEAEMVLPPFIAAYQRGEPPADLPGVVWRQGEEIRFAGFPPECQDLDSVPFPARHLVPNEAYYNFISEKKNYTVVNTSRGCPFRCIFCEAAGKPWRARTPVHVVDEFEQCYVQHGIREVDIFDSSFTISKKRVIEICRELKRRGLHREMIWDVRSRVDTIDEEMLVELKEAGCYRIFYGVESGNPQILKTLRKAADLKRMEHIITLTKKIGISTFAYFLVGCPGETLQTVRETVEFAKRLPLDFCIFNRLTAFPKTALYEKYYLPNASRDFWAEYISRPEPLEEFMGRPWLQSLTKRQVDELTHSAMLEFYFRPIQLWRAIKSVRSMHQFERYCKAGIDMLLGFGRSYLIKKEPAAARV